MSLTKEPPINLLSLIAAKKEMRFKGYCIEKVIQYGYLGTTIPFRRCHCFDDTEDLVVYP